MVKCRGQQDDMGTVSKGHLELWHQKNPSNKLVFSTRGFSGFHARPSRWVPQAHEMCVFGVACFFFNGRFHGTMMNTGCRYQVAVISDVWFSYYSLRLEAIVAFCGHFGFSAEEMADGRHGVFDGQLLRWSDGSTWRRVDEQSGVHQAIFCESTAKKNHCRTTL